MQMENVDSKQVSSQVQATTEKLVISYHIMSSDHHQPFAIPASRPESEDDKKKLADLSAAYAAS